MKYAGQDDDHSKDLQSAELTHLILGTTLYLRDPRRTPVTVVARDPETASFTVQVADFEDRGAEWVFPLWDVSKFLVNLGVQELSPPELAALSARISSLNQQERIDCEEKPFAESQSEIAAIQLEIDDWLCLNFSDLPADADMLFSSNVPCEFWSSALEQLMDFKGLLMMDNAFSDQFTSNPHAGEMVKGHRIVLAELGLCPFEGHPVRDQKIFRGNWTKAKRREHIKTRLAFMRVVLSKLKISSLPLYRTVYSEGALTKPRNSGFVSATFSRQVALSLLDAGQQTRMAAMFWQRVPVDRLFMSYLETPTLSSRYQEAEAVLLFDPLQELY